MNFLEPGPIGCFVFGAVVDSNSTNVLPTDKLPKECTSFFWDDIVSDVYYNYYSEQGDVSEGNKIILTTIKTIKLCIINYF